MTQRVPRGGFGEDSAPPAVSCGSWTKAQHQRGGYKRARREQKASALARAHLTEKSIGSCFRVISGKSRILLDRRKLDFRVRTTCFRCLGKVRDFDQWEIRTWELLAGEVDQSGGRCVSEPPNITHSPSPIQRWRLRSRLGNGTRAPLRGGLFSFGGSIQQSCGLLHGEERRPPEALGRSEAPPARDFACIKSAHCPSNFRSPL